MLALMQLHNNYPLASAFTHTPRCFTFFGFLGSLRRSAITRASSHLTRNDVIAPALSRRVRASRADIRVDISRDMLRHTDMRAVAG